MTVLLWFNCGVEVIGPGGVVGNLSGLISCGVGGGGSGVRVGLMGPTLWAEGG